MTRQGGRHSSGRYRVRIRSIALLFAIALLVGAGVGSTVALLQDKTDAVENTFTYGKVSCAVQEDFNKENNIYVKRNVRIQNTGNTDAYIRVLLVFTWKDKDGNVFVNKPVENRDFQANMNLSQGWIISRNTIGSYIYYKNPVAPGQSTPNLIDSLFQIDGANVPENGAYHLSVEVVAEAVQANPAQAVNDAWDEATVNADGTLSIQGGISYEGDPTEADQATSGT